MYPSEHYPSFGVFVKNFAENIQDEEITICDRTLIQGKKSGLQLIWAYFIFFFEILIKANFRTHDLIYVHYVQHSLLPLNFWVRKKKKLILNAHGSDLTNSGKLYRWMRKLNKKVFVSADLFVVPSDFFIEKVLALGVQKNRVYVYPSGGIDTDLFRPFEINEGLKYRFGYLGRLDKGKGVETLFKAISGLDPTVSLRLDLVGSGLEEKKLKILAENLGIAERVAFFGVRTQEELPSIFSTWDALVFPSELEESLGLVGIEAMACGLPVIGSNAAGIMTYLNHYVNGLTFTPGNANELRQQILDFLELSPEDLKKLKANAIHTAIGYNRDFVNSKLKKRIKALFYT